MHACSTRTFATLDAVCSEVEVYATTGMTSHHDAVCDEIEVCTMTEITSRLRLYFSGFGFSEREV